MFVDDSLVTFDVVDGHAVLSLAVDVPAELDADGWSALVKQTLIVADGPGDAGYLVKRLDTNGTDRAPDGWDAAVERRDALTLVFGARRDGPSRELPLVTP